MPFRSRTTSTDAEHPVPPSEDRGTAEVPRETSRRARFLLRDMDLGRFVRRLAQAMDFWRGQDAGDGQADTERLREWCREALDKRGRMGGLVAIASVADAYTRMDAEQRTDFYRMLREAFTLDDDRVNAAVEAYRNAADGREPALLELSRALESPRRALFQQFNTIPQGVKFLIDLRADILARLKTQPELATLEYELRLLLETFFNLGFLELKRITWESPAALLENLVNYESVHQIANWRDLKHRLISDRACFAYLHPAMPCEPVIFVEVALVRGMADNIQHLLDLEAPDLRPDQADTAIFYSISNAQRGLRGIAFGNLLIKQVATRLRGEVPNLQTFATLSPLPRFRRDFVEPALADGTIGGFYTEAEGEHLMQLAEASTVPGAVQSLLEHNQWHRRPEVADALKPGLMRAARAYLTGPQRDGRTACPVGHFHGSNGARLERINWLGDTSRKGLEQSCGIMVNYIYDLDRFERYQNDYAQSGTLVAGRAVRDL